MNRGPQAGRLLSRVAAAGIPEEDRDSVVKYVGQEFAGLHEGNIMRYRLKADDLAALQR